MPYIKQYRRNAFDPLISELAAHVGGLGREGEANYIITKLLLNIFNSNYKEYNAAMGVLECCKFEFYERAVKIYEQKKCAENGDVY